MAKKSKKILFVCSGNIFRSMTAEYCLKNALRQEKGKDFIIGSAGTEPTPQEINKFVYDELISLGIDPSEHRQRRLTRRLMEGYDLVVAMSTDHKEFIKKNFNMDVPLFKKICYNREEPLLDVWEVVPDYLENLEETEKYMRSTVDYIYQTTPNFLKNMKQFM